VAAVLVAVTAGCASIPTGGPVREGRDLRLDRDDDAVRVIGQPPAPGAEPADIVRGFLRANADFADDHRVARMYLAPKAREEWSPSRGTAVYDRGEGFSVTAADEESPDAPVTLSAVQLAAIDPDGRYRPAPTDTVLERTFGMTRVDGEWRIAELDPGLALTRGDVEETYRPLNLYFLAPSRTILVPDTVFLPSLPGLSTNLVNRLLRGPTSALRGAVTSAFPQGTSLELSSVPIRDGVASVDLDETVLRADSDARDLMSAQIVWTLKQLGVRSVRITAGGEPLSGGGSPVELDRDAWATVDPAGLSELANAYAVRAGRVVQVVDGKVSPVGGPAGAEDAGARRPAVSLDPARPQVAYVSGDGSTVLRTRVAEGAEVRTVLSQPGADFAQPSWDPAGNLWLLDRSTGKVHLLPAGEEQPVPVPLPDAATGPLVDLRVSRDGTRLALVAGPEANGRLLVGAVLPGDGAPGSVTIGNLRSILPSVRGVADVAWLDADRIALVGRLLDAPAVPLVTDTSGFDQSAVDPQAGLVALAAAPGNRPLVGATARGRLLQYTASRGWVSLGEGADPTYPG
jgi:hypothetical protein